MTLRQLQWTAVLAPLFFIGILEYARFALGPTLSSWQGHLLMNAVVLICAAFFYGAVFTVVRQMHERLLHQNRELEALRRAGMLVVSELSLDSVLQMAVDQASELIGARYGALSVIDHQGEIHSFITTGIDYPTRKKIGPPPVGRGLLGVPLNDGRHLRISDIPSDFRSCGFPEGHPEMRTLLAVPVICNGPFKGNLYLSEKKDGSGFTRIDEDVLARFALEAAIAVDNAHLHSQVSSLAVSEERLRLAREMHDGQAQVLAFVNTKAQAVRELLRSGRHEDAAEHLDQLASAAREVYKDVREGILGLRSVVDTEHDLSQTLRRYSESWQDQCGITVQARLEDVPRLPAEVELQLLRIVQEAMANVRKHSEAESVRISLQEIHDGLRLRVEDDGIGMRSSPKDRSHTPRFGLATMRERAEAIGAELEMDSREGVGTRWTITYQEPKR